MRLRKGQDVLVRTPRYAVRSHDLTPAFAYKEKPLVQQSTFVT